MPSARCHAGGDGAARHPYDRAKRILAARLPFQLVKIRFFPLKPKQISFRFGERDRLGRTIRRPAEWLGDGSGLPTRFKTGSEFKNEVANLPQEVESGTCGFGFCFFDPTVSPVQIVRRTHFFDFLWDGGGLKT
jgi:hypothetical protein